jgi:hypothetical protein
MLVSHSPDSFLVDSHGLYFRGFVLGRPAYTSDQMGAICYSQKLAVKVAEKMARMYGANLLVVADGRGAKAEGRAAAGVPEFHTPPSNTGVNESQPVARGSL